MEVGPMLFSRRSSADPPPIILSVCKGWLHVDRPVGGGRGAGAAETISGAVDGKRILLWKGYVHTLYALQRNQ